MSNDKKGMPAVNALAKAMSDAGQPITFGNAQAIVRADKSKTSRVLKQLVNTGSVVKARIAGTTEHVWGSTPGFIKAVAKSVDGTWVPPPEFWHDQIALLVMYSLAEPCSVMPERLVLGLWPKASRAPDGLVALLASRKLAAIEVEKSKKTGRQNGFDRLAASMVKRMYGDDCFAPVLEQYLEDKEDPLKVMETVLVAPRGYAVSIARRITRILLGNGDMKMRSWLYVELDANGKLSQVVTRWFAGVDAPAQPVYLLWKPKDRR